MKKVIIALVLLMLCAGISAVVYANEPPTNLSFEIAYEIDTTHGKFVFSNEPFRVEPIASWAVIRFSPYFDRDATYELRHFPIGTLVAFVCSESSTLKRITLEQYCSEWFFSNRTLLHIAYELTLSDNVAGKWGTYLQIHGKNEYDDYHFYFPIFVSTPVPIEPIQSAYTEKPPLSLSFDIAYEVSVPHGRYVFSNEPNKVESVNGRDIRHFGLFFIGATYELRYFPQDTVVAFMVDDDNTFGEILVYQFLPEYSIMPIIIGSSHELVLSERYSTLQSGLFFLFWGELCDGRCCAFIPVVIGCPEYFARFTIGNSNVRFSTGISREYDTSPFIDPANNRTMIPLRAVSEALATEVTWDSETQTANIFTETEVIRLPVDIPLPNNMGTPVIHENRIFVPLRYVAEILGVTTRWDSENMAVYIYL